MKTYTPPTAHEAFMQAHGQGSVSESFTIPANTKWFLVGLVFDADVVPADYPAIQTAMKAIDGIANVVPIADQREANPAPPDAEHSYRLVVSANVRPVHTPAEPE